MRAREAGIEIGTGEPGRHNAITDVAGVQVGYATLVSGSGELVVGAGPVRTGVTVVLPHGGRPSTEPVFAGYHRLNGFGELTGLEWLHESGMLASPIALTNTNSVGVVRDTIIAREVALPGRLPIMLPVVGETWDGILNDIGGQHVRPEHVHAAFADARSGAIAEGNVGGGTGLQCYGFKGGTGTASRVVALGEHTYTVGVLVQANHGDRRHFEVNGVPIGQVLGSREVPVPRMSAITRVPPGTGSVLAVVATDAPLLPHQLNRMAQRAGLGIAKFGARGDNYSGDLMIAFSTAAHGLPDQGPGARTAIALSVDTLALPYVDAMFAAVIEATAEAILNAMLQAQTMAGRDDLVLRALNADQLADILEQYGRRRYSVR
ncbi:MAG: P1 family peptidase [Candidatus Nanopelagicales bacterium]|nr:P1 family peptidase [Candidatus Nanopelagicales bacterium]